MQRLPQTDPERPVLIAGPTASGKSALALDLAARQGGVIVNADALQVFANWRVLTARPGPQEEAGTRHALYGHVPRDGAYSAGHWLRDVVPLLSGDARPIIVGGTGLYFAALTEGLAEIPPTPQELRALADARRKAEGHAGMFEELDAETQARVDPLNPMRVQRAWEVWRATGRGLAAWHDDTPAPVLPLADVQPFVLNADRDWLNARIHRRFDRMLDSGALDEARANLAGWDPALQSSRAIGAAELIACLKGQISLVDAVTAAKTASRQYAKRQRSWFRGRMRDWHVLDLP